MKGTAPRGRTTREDREIAEWLRNDAKNRSENVMIVDLLRNDLGRVARFGTRARRKSLRCRALSHALADDLDRHAPNCGPTSASTTSSARCFPAAPSPARPRCAPCNCSPSSKSAPRGVYTGAIGFFSPQQTVFNVAIRTLRASKAAAATMGAGSGIVIDSDPAEEFRECLLKARFPHRSNASRRRDPVFAGQPDEFLLIETMLWDGAYPLLELHLDRLTDSADYFGFALRSRGDNVRALEEHRAAIRR